MFIFATKFTDVTSADHSHLPQQQQQQQQSPNGDHIIDRNVAVERTNYSFVRSILELPLTIFSDVTVFIHFLSLESSLLSRKADLAHN